MAAGSLDAEGDGCCNVHLRLVRAEVKHTTMEPTGSGGPNTGAVAVAF